MGNGITSYTVAMCILIAFVRFPVDKYVDQVPLSRTNTIRLRNELGTELPLDQLWSY
jgi:hypothetical protein